MPILFTFLELWQVYNMYHLNIDISFLSQQKTYCIQDLLTRALFISSNILKGENKCHHILQCLYDVMKFCPFLVVSSPIEWLKKSHISSIPIKYQWYYFICPRPISAKEADVISQQNIGYIELYILAIYSMFRNHI